MLKKILSLLLCGVFTLSLTPCVTAAPKEEGNAPILGEWMWASTIADMGPDGAEILLSRCAEMGVTDVYLLVKGTGGTLGYLNTQYKDRVSRKNRDVLQEAIDAAHPRGIRIHAWVCNMEDSAYKAAHPNAGMWHYIRQRDNDRINLYDPDYLTYMSNIASELAAYDIDGLHLDYIRYNHLANGWSESDFSALQARGADPERVKELIEITFGYHGHSENANYIFNAYRNGDRTAHIIAEYRRENVKTYAKTIISAAKKVKPDLIISAATMPEGAYDEAFANLHYGQSYDDASELYDYICPMSYSTNYGKNDQWVATLAKNAVAKGNKVVMGLQAYDSATSLRMMSEIDSLKALGSTDTYGDSVLGAVLFRTGTVDYAKLTNDAQNRIFAVKLFNVGASSTCRQIRIDLKNGIRVTQVELGEGINPKAAVSISPSGNSITIKASEVFSGDSHGYAYLKYEGTPPTGTVPAIVEFTRSANICTYTASHSLGEPSADLGTPPNTWITQAPAESADTPTSETQDTPADEGSPSEGGFSPIFLIPIFAALLGISAAVTAVLWRKKKKV